MYKINSKDSELVNPGTEMGLGRRKKNSGEHLVLIFSAQFYFSSRNGCLHIDQDRVLVTFWTIPYLVMIITE